MKTLPSQTSCSSSVVLGVQEAEDLLEAHGERLARRLGAEVSGLRASAIADLDIVFPIRDLAGRRPPVHRRATGLEGTIDARNGPLTTPEPAQAQRVEAPGNSRGGYQRRGCTT